MVDQPCAKAESGKSWRAEKTSNQSQEAGQQARAGHAPYRKHTDGMYHIKFPHTGWIQGAKQTCFSNQQKARKEEAGQSGGEEEQEEESHTPLPPPMQIMKDPNNPEVNMEFYY